MQDISDLNEIMTDLACLVHAQGEVVDSIEANVDKAQQHVEAGGRQVGDKR
jgi:t-SNARE complex subunit (syntaxin)